MPMGCLLLPSASGGRCLEVVSGMVTAAWSLRLLFVLVLPQPLNKLDLLLQSRSCEAEPPLAGHGGEGERLMLLQRREVEALPAGRGGEEESCFRVRPLLMQDSEVVMVAWLDSPVPPCLGYHGGDQDLKVVGSGCVDEDDEASPADSPKHRQWLPLLPLAKGADSHLRNPGSEDSIPSLDGGTSGSSSALIAVSNPSGLVPGSEMVAVAGKSTSVLAEKDLIAFQISCEVLFAKSKGYVVIFLLLVLLCICNLPL